jgi:hypothetical protein
MIPWSARIVQVSQTYNFSLFLSIMSLQSTTGFSVCHNPLMKFVLWNFMYYRWWPFRVSGGWPRVRFWPMAIIWCNWHLGERFRDKIWSSTDYLLLISWCNWAILCSPKSTQPSLKTLGWKEESCNRVKSGIWHAFERGVDLDKLRGKGRVEMS